MNTISHLEMLVYKVHNINYTLTAKQVKPTSRIGHLIAAVLLWYGGYLWRPNESSIASRLSLDGSFFQNLIEDGEET